MSVSVADTTTLLEDIQGESPSLAANNAPFWANQSTQHANESTPAGLGTLFVSEAETSIAEQVFRLYEGLLGHKPDSSGFQTYINEAEAGLTPSQVAIGATAVAGSTWTNIVSQMMNTSEYAARFMVGTTLTPDETVTLLYDQILHRLPTTAEQTYYMNLINTGTSMNTLLQYFVNSQEFINDTKSQIDASLLNAGLTDVQAGSGATHTYAEIAFGHSSSADAVALVGVTHAAAAHHV